MPSSKNPNALIIGVGRAPANTVTASAQLFPNTGNLAQAALDAVNRPFAIVPDVINIPTYTSTGETTRTLTGSAAVWVGSGGENARNLFRVVTSPASTSFLDFEPIVGDGGNIIEATGITGASIGDGFITASSITVTFSGPLPVGVQYRILYGISASLTSMETASLSQIRKMSGLEASAETLSQAILSGLDERYRRQVGSPAPQDVNAGTPGDGAIITRDGQAVAIEGEVINQSDSADWIDPYQTLLRLEANSSYGTTVISEEFAADSGVMFVSAHPGQNTTSEVKRPHLSGPALIDMTVYDVRANTLLGDTVRTRISGNDTASWTSGEVTLSGSSYGRTGGETAIRLGIDLLEITFTDGNQETIVSVITSFTSDIILNTTPPNLSTAGPFGGPRPCTLRWLRPRVHVGGTLDYPWLSGSSTIRRPGPFFYSALPPATDGDQEVTCLPAEIYAGTLDEVLWTGNQAEQSKALALGGHDPSTGSLVERITFYGGGSTVWSGGRQTANIFRRRSATYNITASGAQNFTWVVENGSYARLSITSAVVAAVTITAALQYDTSSASQGDTLVLVFSRDPASTGNLTVNWPSDFLFSGDDGVLPVTGAFHTRFLFEYDGANWLAVRTDYI